MNRFTTSLGRAATSSHTMLRTPVVQKSKSLAFQECTCRLQSTFIASRRSITTLTAQRGPTAYTGRSLSFRNASTSPEQPSVSQLTQESFRRRQSRVRPLPVIKDQKRLYFGVAAFAITAWSCFVLWAMNAEKAASSVVRTLTFNLRSSPIVKEALGEGVREKPFFIVGTEPWIHGTVNTIRGVVDISFRVQSASGREATVYFKSERPNKAARFQTLDFKLIVDGNPPHTVDLQNTDLLGLADH